VAKRTFDPRLILFQQQIRVISKRWNLDGGSSGWAGMRQEILEDQHTDTLVWFAV